MVCIRRPVGRSSSSRRSTGHTSTHLINSKVRIFSENFVAVSPRTHCRDSGCYALLYVNAQFSPSKHAGAQEVLTEKLRKFNSNPPNTAHERGTNVDSRNESNQSAAGQAVQIGKAEVASFAAFPDPFWINTHHRNQYDSDSLYIPQPYLGRGQGRVPAPFPDPFYINSHHRNQDDPHSRERGPGRVPPPFPDPVWITSQHRNQDDSDDDQPPSHTLPLATSLHIPQPQDTRGPANRPFHSSVPPFTSHLRNPADTQGSGGFLSRLFRKTTIDHPVKDPQLSFRCRWPGCQVPVRSDQVKSLGGYCCNTEMWYVTLSRRAGCRSGSYYRLGMQFTMAWRSNAGASGFVPRDRIIVVRHVPTSCTEV